MTQAADDFAEFAKADALSLLNGDVSESITYTVKQTGYVKPIQAVIYRRPAQIQQYEDGAGVPFVSDVVISTDDTNGIEVPCLDDMVTFDSTDWGITSIDIDTVADTAALVVTSYDAKIASRRDSRWNR